MYSIFNYINWLPDRFFFFWSLTFENEQQDEEICIFQYNDIVMISNQWYI